MLIYMMKMFCINHTRKTDMVRGSYIITGRAMRRIRWVCFNLHTGHGLVIGLTSGQRKWWQWLKDSHNPPPNNVHIARKCITKVLTFPLLFLYILKHFISRSSSKQHETAQIIAHVNACVTAKNRLQCPREDINFTLIKKSQFHSIPSQPFFLFSPGMGKNYSV